LKVEPLLSQEIESVLLTIGEVKGGGAWGMGRGTPEGGGPLNIFFIF